MTDIVGNTTIIIFWNMAQYFVSAAFFKAELSRVSSLLEVAVPVVEKLTGDNSKGEKERVLDVFKNWYAPDENNHTFQI